LRGGEGNEREKREKRGTGTVIKTGRGTNRGMGQERKKKRSEKRTFTIPVSSICPRCTYIFPKSYHYPIIPRRLIRPFGEQKTEVITLDIHLYSSVLRAPMQM
jgi:hypothetical protein